MRVKNKYQGHDSCVSKLTLIILAILGQSIIIDLAWYQLDDQTMVPNVYSNQTLKEFGQS